MIWLLLIPALLMVVILGFLFVVSWAIGGSDATLEEQAGWSE